MRRQTRRPMGGPVALLLVLTVVCPRAGANDKTLVLSSHSLEDPDRFALALSCTGASESDAKCFARPCCRDLPPLELLDADGLLHIAEPVLRALPDLEWTLCAVRATHPQEASSPVF